MEPASSSKSVGQEVWEEKTANKTNAIEATTEPSSGKSSASLVAVEEDQDLDEGRSAKGGEEHDGEEGGDDGDEDEEEDEYPEEDGDENVDDDDDQEDDDGEDRSESDEDDYDDEDSELDEMPEITDEEKTPVTVVTGFLGAGKTTLVNYILKEQTDMKIVVIENEYGAVSIDTALVEENLRQAEDIVTMDNGCVCCTVRGDLVKALVQFLDRRHTFDCILLETTGIADPSPIVATFNQEPDVALNYRIDSVLCLVDAKNILKQLERKSKEEGALNEAVQQLAFADSVIINKTDLVDEAQLEAVKGKINSVNPFAKVVQAEKSRVPLKSVLNLRSYNLERTLELLDEEAKEEDARRKAAEEKEANKAKDEKAKKAAGAGEGHACGDASCSHDHKHESENGGHKHSSECGEGCSHDHGPGEKRKREAAEGGEAGDAVATAADATASKKPKELLRVSATRHDSNVGSLGLTLQGSFDVELFNKFMGDFLEKHSANLFRSKGVLSFKDQTRKFVFQGVHEQINCEPSSTEWATDGHDRESKIVFIGLELDKDEITKKLKECLVPES